MWVPANQFDLWRGRRPTGQPQVSFSLLDVNCNRLSKNLETSRRPKAARSTRGRESRSYYLIGYVPKDVKPDGRFRKIEVKLGRSGLTVRARKGYFAPTAAEAGGAPRTADLDPEVRKALDSPRDLADLPVRATALVFDQSGADAARVVISADVDINGFSFEPEEDSRLGGAVEFAVAATHLGSGRVYHFDQTIEMHLSPETRRRLGVTWYSMSRSTGSGCPRRF
jgi:hypothetical protein